MSYAATIIIPLKRQNDDWLDQCVRSALAQTTPCEVIVARSQATPPSNLQILQNQLQESSNLRVMADERVESFPGRLNLGIRAASAERIGFLLSDDWLEPEAVARCLPLAADIVSTGLTSYHADGRTLIEGGSRPRTMATYTLLRSAEARADYLGYFFVFRKDALVQRGGLDETIGNFPGIDDYDLIWTLLEHGATVGIVEERLYNFRDHNGERLTLADKGEAIRNLEKILRKHGVPEAELPQLVADKSRWFGKPLHQVLEEDRRGRAAQDPERTLQE